MPVVVPATIPRGPVELAARLHVPEAHDERRRHAAVVISTPGSSVKEQIGATYAHRLAERGLIAVTVDPAHQGESAGEPRDLEDPAERVADLHAVVDHVTALRFVDPGRVGMVGICAGGGYAVHAARVDHRVRALGAVVPVDIGRAFRAAAAAAGQGIAGTLDDIADRLLLETRDRIDGEPRSGVGEQHLRLPWLPDSPDEARAAGVTDIDLLQAVDYYRTARGHHPRSTNRRHHRSDAAILGFDAFALVEELLTQPVQVVVAGEAGSTGSRVDGERLARLAPAAEDVLVVDEARHYEMYDRPEYVGRAVDRLAAFFQGHLR